MFFLSSEVEVSILWDMTLGQVSRVTGLSTLEDSATTLSGNVRHKSLIQKLNVYTCYSI
jgi:hypothetical protein